MRTFLILSKSGGEPCATIIKFNGVVLSPSGDKIFKYNRRCNPQEEIFLEMETDPNKLDDMLCEFEQKGFIISEITMNDFAYARMCEFLASGRQTIGERFAV